MEFRKIDEFLDLTALLGQQEQFIKLVDDIIAKIKSIGVLEMKISGAENTKDAAAAMAQLAKEQKGLADQTKQYTKAVDQENRTLLANAKATTESTKQKYLNAKATTEQSKAEVNNAKAVTETNRQKLLQQKYEANVTKEKERLEKATVKELKQNERLTNAYEQLKFKYQLAANTAKQLGAAEGINSENFKQSAAAAQAYYLQLIQLEDAVGQSQRKVGQYTNATFALNQVLRETPSFVNSVQTGFLSISNNLPILSDEFKKLVAATGSSTKALGIMFRSLFTFQTALVIGITLLTAFGKEIGNFFSKLFAGSREFDKAAEGVRAMNKAIQDTSYKDAVKNVNEMRINIGLAKQGFLDKTKVLKLYNEGLGETIGKANSLNEAEQLLIENGDAYIQMTLLKAAANAALEEAAGKALDIAKKQLERSPEENTDLRREAFKRATAEEKKLYKERAKEIEAAFLAGNTQLQDSLSKQQEALFQTFVERGFADKLKKEQSGLLDIAKNFQEQAAAIAKALNFNFFGDDTEKDKGKTTEDFAKDLAKQREDQLKLTNDITRTRLEGQQAALLAAAQKERQVLQLKGESWDNYRARLASSLQEQLGDYQAYYDKSLELLKFNTQAEIAELEQRTAEEKRQVQETLDDKTKKLTAQQRQDLQDTLVAIDAKAAVEKQLIVLKGNEAILAFERQYEGEVTKLTTEQLAERIKKRLEYFEKLKTLLEAERDFQNNNLTELTSNDIRDLNRQLRAKEITVKEYNKKRLQLEKQDRIERLDNDIDYLEKLLKATATTEEEKAAIEARIAELRLKKDQELTDQKINNLKKVNDAYKQLGNEAVQTFEAIIVARYEKEKNQVQDLIDLNEQKRQKDIDAAQQGASSAAEAADKIAAINARADAQKQALERRQRQIDQERARFERMAEVARIIANTSVGVTNALSGPPPAPPNPLLAGIIAATGALQLARVLATPIPRYAQGLDEAKTGHLAIVGDGGRREVVHYGDGSHWVTPGQATLTWIPEGASVSKSLDEARSVHGILDAAMAQPDSGPDMGYYTGVISREMKLTRQAILNKKENHFSIRNGQVDMRTRDGYNETHYINSNLQF